MTARAAIPSWADCAAAGMSTGEAAAARGMTPGAASIAAKAQGLTFRDARKDPAARARIGAISDRPGRRQALRDRMMRFHACSEFQARRVAGIRRWYADPANNPLAALSAAERADYDVLRRKGRLSRDAALRAVGRGDLIEGGAACP